MFESMPVDACSDDLADLSTTQKIRFYGERITPKDFRGARVWQFGQYPSSPNWRDVMLLDLASSIFPVLLPRIATFAVAWESQLHRPDDILDDHYVSVPPEDRYKVKLRIRNVVVGEPRVVESEELVDE